MAGYLVMVHGMEVGSGAELIYLVVREGDGARQPIHIAVIVESRKYIRLIEVHLRLAVG
jgi:hypothetical protein